MMTLELLRFIMFFFMLFFGLRQIAVFQLFMHWNWNRILIGSGWCCWSIQYRTDINYALLPNICCILIFGLNSVFGLFAWFPFATIYFRPPNKKYVYKKKKSYLVIELYNGTERDVYQSSIEHTLFIFFFWIYDCCCYISLNFLIGTVHDMICFHEIMNLTHIIILPVIHQVF